MMTRLSRFSARAVDENRAAKAKPGSRVESGIRRQLRSWPQDSSAMPSLSGPVKGVVMAQSLGGRTCCVEPCVPAVKMRTVV